MRTKNIDVLTIGDWQLIATAQKVTVICNTKLVSVVKRKNKPLAAFMSMLPPMFLVCKADLMLL